MAERIIIYWRDIPAQVIVRRGRTAAKRELPARFLQAIDRCAMTVGAKDSEAYLAEWRKADAQLCSDDLEAEADAALAEILETVDDRRLGELVANGGRVP
jgi:hypothetical protein